MFCNKCGSQLDPNAKFCVKCGSALEFNTQNPNVNNTQMPQSVNQNVGPQYPPNANNNKTMKYVLIFVGVIVALFIVKTVATSILLINGDDIKEKIEDELKNNPDLTDDEFTEDEDTKRVGTDDFGYVSVPKDWVKYVDTVTPGTFQYSSTDGYIVTLLYYEDSAGKSEEYATTLFQNMEDGGATGVTGAKVKVGDVDAFQVYGYYPDNKLWVVTWMLEPGDGQTHYIALEGPDRNSEYFDIPKTFSINK